MARRLDLRRAPAYRPDGNATAYKPEDDGRSAGGERVRYVTLRHIHRSRHQTRVLTDPEADRLLAEDIDAHGLTHAPVVRPHPDLPGEWETVVGHRRIVSLRILAREGRGASVLRGSGPDPEDRLAPVIVRELDDVTAQTITVGENLLRADLRPWEQAVALERLRRSLEKRGERASVRGLAAHLEASHQTIAPYVRVAQALTPEVLQLAGVVLPGETVEEGAPAAALCTLSLAALERAARPCEPSARARALVAELARARQPPAENGGAKEPRSTDPERGSHDDPMNRGVQLHIRRPVGVLRPAEAQRYLIRLAPALGALVRVASEGDGSVSIPLGNSRVLVVGVQEQRD